MARIIQMPSKDELPEGPTRTFVVALRLYYRSAGRPALREISKLIEGRQDLNNITASQETIRRILRGLVVPHDWNRVNAVLQVFCELSKIDPEADADQWEHMVESHRDYIKRLWDEALEAEPDAPRTLPPTPPPPSSRPGSGGGGFSDDPPF
ncbi:hypothetical protein [Actinomadura sp. 9N407]|uniref:hypothetical protein n=1 Tax=Actinomadura sp. 9N407 TaxID=3375154 RepID=UPI00379D1CFD